MKSERVIWFAAGTKPAHLKYTSVLRRLFEAQTEEDIVFYSVANTYYYPLRSHYT